MVGKVKDDAHRKRDDFTHYGWLPISLLVIIGLSGIRLAGEGLVGQRGQRRARNSSIDIRLAERQLVPIPRGAVYVPRMDRSQRSHWLCRAAIYDLLQW
jgi:hypothetical protein